MTIFLWQCKQSSWKKSVTDLQSIILLNNSLHHIYSARILAISRIYKTYGMDTSIHICITDIYHILLRLRLNKSASLSFCLVDVLIGVLDFCKNIHQNPLFMFLFFNILVTCSILFSVLFFIPSPESENLQHQIIIPVV